MNKKIVIQEYVNKNKYCSLDEIVKLTDLGRKTAIKYLQELKSRRIIYSAGRGFYSSVSKEFTHEKNSRVTKISQFIKKEFPDLDFLIWNTLYFQPFYHHQQSHNITFLETESDGIHPVVEKVSEFYRHVFIATKSKKYPSGFDIAVDPIIVKRLIKRSPRNGNEPSLEKMLVDLYAVKDKYNTMSDADYWELWNAICSVYRINIPALIDYGVKRRSMTGMITQLTEKTELSKVINVNNFSLLTKMTKRKRTND